MFFSRPLLTATVGLALASFSGIAIALLSQGQAIPDKKILGETVPEVTKVAACPEKYATSTFGYELCFPAGWEAIESGQDKELVRFHPREDREAVEITVYAVEAKSSTLLATLRQSLRVSAEVRVSIGEKDGTEIRGTTGSGPSISTVLSDDRYSYEISLAVSAETYNVYLPIYRNMLGSWTWLPIAKQAPARSDSGDLLVEQPTYKAVVRSPLIIKGQVRSADAALAWRIKNTDGSIVASGKGAASPGEPGQPQHFSMSATFAIPKPPDPGTLEVFATEEDLVRVPIRFK